jgi:hypothetical protein
MAKKAQKPEQEKPQEGQDDPIPQEAWDKMDDLLGKALGVDGGKAKGRKKKAG